MSKNNGNKRETIRALYEGTLEEYHKAQEENALKTIRAQNYQVEYQMRKAEFDARLDKIKSGKQELADMTEAELLSEKEKDELTRELDVEEKKLRDEEEKAAQEYEAENKKRVEEVNKLREKVRSLEGKVDVHRRILSRLDPEALKPVLEATIKDA